MNKQQREETLRLIAAFCFAVLWPFMGVAVCGKAYQQLERFYCWSFDSCGPYNTGGIAACILGILLYLSVAVLAFGLVGMAYGKIEDRQ